MQKRAQPKEEGVEELRVLPSHIFSRIGGFDVHFKRDGRVEARKEYSNIPIITTYEKGGQVYERNEVVDKARVEFSCEIVSLPPRIFLSKKSIYVNFELDGKKKTVKGIFLAGDSLSWLEDEEGTSLAEDSIELLERDVRSFRKNLIFALQLHPQLSKIFQVDLKAQEARDRSIQQLADEVERVSKEFDVRKNPIPLLPLFNKAREKEALDDVIRELENRCFNTEKAQQLNNSIHALRELRRRMKEETSS